MKDEENVSTVTFKPQLHISSTRDLTQTCQVKVRTNYLTSLTGLHATSRPLPQSDLVSLGVFVRVKAGEVVYSLNADMWLR